MATLVTNLNSAVRHFLTATLNAGGAKPRRTVLNGREYLIAPLVSIVPGVLAGSKGPLLYPAEECARNARDWDGTPIVIYHPSDPLTNRPMSAGENITLHVGFLKDSRFDGRLRHAAWFDTEKLRAMSADTLNRLERGQPVEVSTGLYTENDKAPFGAAYRGKPYDWVARQYKPDHLAVLPDQVGACILPGQEIQGRILKASKARYTGQAVCIRTALGAVLSVTANHPVLTATGFIPAGEITEGQHLLHYVGEDKSNPSDSDEEYAPAKAEKVFETLAGLGSSEKSVRHRASPLDFHGDAAFFKGDVEVVFPDSTLRLDRVSKSTKSLIEGYFGRGGHSQLSLPSCSPLLETADWVNSTDVGGVGSSGECLTLVDTETRIHQVGGVREAPRDSSVLEPLVDHAAIDADFDSNVIGALATEVEVDCTADKLIGKPLSRDSLFASPRVFGPGAELDICLPKSQPDRADVEAKVFGELLDAFPGKILLDQVVGVDRFLHDDLVFDFESVTGYIVAEGLIVSNCSLRDGCGLMVNAATDVVGNAEDEGWRTLEGGQHVYVKGDAMSPHGPGEKSVSKDTPQEKKPTSAKPTAGKAPKTKTPKATDEMAGHPMKGMSHEEMIQHLSKHGSYNSAANPHQYGAESYPKGVNGPKLVEDVKAHVKATQSKNSYVRPTLKDAYDAVKGSHPGLTIHGFHSALAVAHANKQIRLDPFTQAKGSIEHPEHMMPLDRETKGYIDLPATRNRRVTANVWTEAAWQASAEARRATAKAGVASRGGTGSGQGAGIARKAELAAGDAAKAAQGSSGDDARAARGFHERAAAAHERAFKAHSNAAMDTRSPEVFREAHQRAADAHGDAMLAHSSAARQYTAPKVTRNDRSPALNFWHRIGELLGMSHSLAANTPQDPKSGQFTGGAPDRGTGFADDPGRGDSHDEAEEEARTGIKTKHTKNARVANDDMGGMDGGGTATATDDEEVTPTDAVGNAAPNQPRHATGRYLHHGAGTGKGPVHDAAIDAAARARLVPPRGGDASPDGRQLVTIEEDPDDGDDDLDYLGHTQADDHANPKHGPEELEAEAEDLGIHNANPEGHNQYTGGGGFNDESRSALAASSEAKNYSKKADEVGDKKSHQTAANAHEDAASAHHEASEAAEAKGNGSLANFHRDLAEKHQAAASHHEKSVSRITNRSRDECDDECDDDNRCLAECLLENSSTDAQVFAAYNREWPQEKRDDLATKDFAGPGRSFPITTQEDLDAAVRSIGRSKHDPAVIRAGIRRIAAKKNLTLPETWDSDETTNANGYEQPQQGPPMEPHDASTQAATASLNAGGDGRDHALTALDHSEADNSPQAAKYHAKAAEAHEADATQARADDDGDEAEDHDQAAALHRKAASMHAADAMSRNRGTDTSWLLTNAELGAGARFASDAARRDAFKAMTANDEDTGHYFGDRNLLTGGYGGDTKSKAAREASDTAVKRSAAVKKAGGSIPGRAAAEHAKAAEAHFAAAKAHKEAGNADMAKQHQKAGQEHKQEAKRLSSLRGGTNNQDNQYTEQPMTRTQIAALPRERKLALVTANCKCEEDRAALNTLADETLDGIIANTAGVSGDPTDWLRAGRKNGDDAGGDSGGDDYDDDEGPLDPDKVKIRKMGPLTGNAAAMNELSLALFGRPVADVRAVVNAAMAHESAAKLSLVRDIVANERDDARRKALGTKYMKKSLAEVRELHGLLGNRRETIQHPTEAAPLFLGAGGVANAYDDAASPTGNALADGDILPLPTVNWKEEAKTRSGATG